MIQELRKKMKLSQQQFATKYQISVGTIRAWEQGVNLGSPALRLLIRQIKKGMK